MTMRLPDCPCIVPIIINHTLTVHTDLTRQYKTMQSQLEGKVEFLEAQVRRLKKTLGKHHVAPTRGEGMQPPIQMVKRTVLSLINSSVKS